MAVVRTPVKARKIITVGYPKNFGISIPKTYRTLVQNEKVYLLYFVNGSTFSNVVRLPKMTII